MMSKVSVEGYRTSYAQPAMYIKEIRGCAYVHVRVITVVNNPSPSTHQPEGFMVYIAILFSFDLKLAEK